MPESLFQVTDNLTPAINSLLVLGSLRGKELAGGMRWIMREWVKEAIDSIPAGSRAKILADLSVRVHLARRKVSAISTINPFSTTLTKANAAARVDKWRSTLAAAIVAIYNIGGARGKSAAAFYQAVNKWAMRKAFGANLHKAGLRQAARQLHIASGGEPAKLLRAPGDYKESIMDEAAEMLAENWASSGNPDAAGIDKLAPNAFTHTAPRVITKFETHYLKLLNQTANRAGFEVHQDAA